MRKMYASMIIVLLAASVTCQAQLNYLFSASTKQYVPVDGGISPQLTMSDPFNANPPWTLSDEGFAQVPIGFTFNYDGKEYTEATICANGFVTLGDTITKRIRPLRLYRNFLAGDPFGFPGVKPVLAPFWDDMDLVDTRNLMYKTTGHKPFRVFTVEWKRTRWTFESTAPALSMELKLYEKTNVIEFHYKDEGGLPFVPRAFASIGITSSYNYRGFISLQNASSHPPISLLRANDSITMKPASNQVYTFTPSMVSIPDPIYNTKYYTNTTVFFPLKSEGAGHFEYAITNSGIPPSSGIETKLGDITVSGLSPATTYYIYARTTKNKNFYSQWTCDSFTTAVNPVPLPYHMSGASDVYPYLPPDLRLQDLYDTAARHYPNSDGSWNVGPSFSEEGISLWSLWALFGTDANEWVFTPGLNLTAGKTYQLSFGYLSFPSQAPGAISSLEVKYGEATGAAAMTAGTLFKRDDIVTDFDLAPMSFEDTTIEIKPNHSGAYYFGFHNITPYDNSQFGPVPVISNMSIAEKVAALVMPVVLAGETTNGGNALNWKATPNKKEKGFNVQRSTDGIHFTTISNVATTNLRNAKYKTSFRVDRNIETVDGADSKANQSFADNRPRFELQRSEDGINFKKWNTVALSNKKPDQKSSYDYIDHNAGGIFYYRLQQVNKYGEASYSNVIKLDKKAVSIGPVVNVYPNPAYSVLNVTVGSTNSAKMNLAVTDAAGNVVISKTLLLAKGNNQIQLSIANLPAGTYNLKLLCSNGCESEVVTFVRL
jgi:hypothetical protein